MERWSVGALERWSVGALERWSVDLRSDPPAAYRGSKLLRTRTFFIPERVAPNNPKWSGTKVVSRQYNLDFRRCKKKKKKILKVFIAVGDWAGLRATVPGPQGGAKSTPPGGGGAEMPRLPYCRIAQNHYSAADRPSAAHTGHFTPTTIPALAWTGSGAE